MAKNTVLFLSVFFVLFTDKPKTTHYPERFLRCCIDLEVFSFPGKMFPTRGDVHIAPFTDDALYMEHFGKSNFW